MPDSEITDLHLWLDFETSGLEIGRDRTLEVAWTITDNELRMLTPLRQRLACIEPPGWPRTNCDGKLFDPRRDRHWDDPDFFDQRGQHGLVQKMHEDSGLRRDHFEAPPEAVLTHARHFERLYLDDLHEAKKRLGGSAFRVILSGAGISHMDVYLLADLLPERFPLLPNPDGSTGMAYWHFDTSTAGRVLGAGVADKLRHWLRDPECPFDLIACEGGQDLWNESGVVNDDNDTAEFDLTGAVPHRAVADVVWSLVDARLMRRIRQAPDLLTSRH